MSRTHRIIFGFIGLLALSTFLFGVLQFVNLHPEPPSHRSSPDTNALVSAADGQAAGETGAIPHATAGH